METINELEERLTTFRSQKKEIESALQADPSNAELLSIVRDLDEVIDVTSQLLKSKAGEQDAKQPHASTGEDHHESMTARYPPNSFCEALYQDKWYPAQVLSFGSKNDQLVYTVVFLGYHNQEVVSESAIRAIESSGMPITDKTKIAPGFTCEAKYHLDGKYYAVEVQELTKYGYKIVYTQFRNVEEVPFQYLREVPKEGSPAQQAVSVNHSSDQTVKEALPDNQNEVRMNSNARNPKIIQIPENLKILPTDAQDEKERKKKRIKAIKSLNRHANIDIERNTKQQGWQAFQSKASKRGSKGFSKKRSMFASPATVTGKVGVVGSDIGMTEFNDTRKRYKMGSGADNRH